MAEDREDRLMAEILIKGMEMPKDRKILVIEPDGSVWEQIADTSYFCTGSKAVEISLERDTPKAPVLKDGESLVHLSKADGTGEFRSSKWLHWTCPVCGAFVGELYVYEGVRHIQRNTPYCAQCGQKIDWDTPRNEIRRQEEN